jgi:hypothetical protein
VSLECRAHDSQPAVRDYLRSETLPTAAPLPQSLVCLSRLTLRHSIRRGRCFLGLVPTRRHSWNAARDAQDWKLSSARDARSCIGDHDHPRHRLDIREPLLSYSAPCACHCPVQSHGPSLCHCRGQNHGPQTHRCRDRNHPLRPELMLRQLRVRGTHSADRREREDEPSEDLQFHVISSQTGGGHIGTTSRVACSAGTAAGEDTSRSISRFRVAARPPRPTIKCH